ncbi:hypothetical protein ACGFZQ_06420 [Streptomyces sp. NPDC048254]|uniref:hypothetical protein n=1 Tax=Streptomyces sp. NPDC048254 TaxID=3365525 RepID=UPI0037212F58
MNHHSRRTVRRQRGDGRPPSSGQYAFWPSNQNHSAFEWAGNLDDTDNGDGHNVYMQVRVEGYA